MRGEEERVRGEEERGKRRGEGERRGGKGERRGAIVLNTSILACTCSVECYIYIYI